MKNPRLQNDKNKQLIANLIIDVLLDKKTVAEALALFPKDKTDINIKCAFDALVHREADEDLRKKIKDYALVQDDYLEKIAELFKKNLPLPKNIIASYIKYHKDNLISDEKTNLNNIIKNLKRMINF